jgi:hypothetical protein
MPDTEQVFIEQTLKVKLTDDELLKYGDDLAKLTDEMKDIEDAKKEAASNFKAKLDVIEGEIHRVSAKIRDKQELRLVKCVEQSDSETKRVNTVRSDTGEIVSWRNMTQEEMQRKLFKAI